MATAAGCERCRECVVGVGDGDGRVELVCLWAEDE
jgi:hypothetical protein